MIRTLRLVVALLLLAACDRPQARGPFVESRPPPGLATRRLPPEGWTWGLMQVGEDPPMRYGVASPAVVPHGDVVIAPGYGQTAEMWFETVRDLEDAGMTVWVIDRAGQGGSGRFVEPRDLGHAPSFDPDVRGLTAFVRQIVRPSGARPVILIAQADAAAPALLAVERGLRLDGLVLSSPRLAAATKPAHGPWLSALWGWFSRDDAPPHGWKPWTRASAPREQAWQLANPDLRMSGPSPGWEKAFALASTAALAEAGAVSTPVIQTGAASGPAPCPRLPNCRVIPVSGESAPPGDVWRTAVLALAGRAADRP